MTGHRWGRTHHRGHCQCSSHNHRSGGVTGQHALVDADEDAMASALQDALRREPGTWSRPEASIGDDALLDWWGRWHGEAAGQVEGAFNHLAAQQMRKLG